MNTYINNIHFLLDKAVQNVVQLLYKENLTLATAESCTGGLLSGAITEVSGSSRVFGLGVCAYANEIKERVLNVNPETLRDYGAVSSQCAAEMSLGVRKISGADIGVSITGIAGPSGGSPQKPVGTVFFACSFKEKLNILHLEICAKKSRLDIRLESVRQALILITDTIS
ncbi:MAG: CinA family protein [Oscillospiraceae bacterium]|nr:CinA family protein [Oscillospiraceae bacterium]